MVMHLCMIMLQAGIVIVLYVHFRNLEKIIKEAVRPKECPKETAAIKKVIYLDETHEAKIREGLDL